MAIRSPLARYRGCGVRGGSAAFPSVGTHDPSGISAQRNPHPKHKPPGERHRSPVDCSQSAIVMPCGRPAIPPVSELPVTMPVELQSEIVEKVSSPANRLHTQRRLIAPIFRKQTTYTKMSPHKTTNFDCFLQKYRV